MGLWVPTWGPKRKCVGGLGQRAAHFVEVEQFKPQTKQTRERLKPSCGKLRFDANQQVFEVSGDVRIRENKGPWSRMRLEEVGVEASICRLHSDGSETAQDRSCMSLLSSFLSSKSTCLFHFLLAAWKQRMKKDVHPFEQRKQRH